MNENFSELSLKKEKQSKENILEPLPEFLRPFYVKEGDRFVNSCYSHNKKLTKSPQGNFDEIDIPVLAFSQNISDLEVSSKPRYTRMRYDTESGWPEEDLLVGLERYCLFEYRGVPIYIFDNHTHALFAWQEAKESGVIDQGAVLIHLDDHLDLVEQPKEFIPQNRKQVAEAIAARTVDIANFIDPAMESGLINQAYFVHSVHGLDFNTLPDPETKLHVGSEGMVIRKYREQERFFDITQMALGDTTFLQKLIEKLNLEGRKIILDIDFDLFFSDRAEALFSVLPNMVKSASVVTCATSPGYINQKKAINLVKQFMSSLT